MNTDTNQIMEILKDIQQQMNVIESKIDALNKTSTNVEQDCQQMRNHIYFIESTYNIVRTPLNYITNKINTLIHNNREVVDLPMIENSNTV
jgi:archaellum component FlaC